MSGDCDKGGEHTLECVCDDDTFTACSDFPVGLAASIIYRSIKEAELIIALQLLEEAGMGEEFQKFTNETELQNIFDALQVFAKLYPDKFVVTDPMEPMKTYGKFIVIG